MQAEDDPLPDPNAGPARLTDEEDYEGEEDVEEYSRWLFQPQWPAPWTLISSVRIDARRWVVEELRDAEGTPQVSTVSSRGSAMVS